ncbi:MAG TPA: PEGA domain-containing protein [Candidatus Magasanikbacteria bacterium]|nr:PEGA domain-containing protein [Candidatus Magasanikbacteria bacterium]
MFGLWIAFFIIAPSVILYTAGYRYDFAKNQIKQTGVLSVDVEPNDSLVSLNGILIERDIPIKLTNRVPGTYLLKIERPGYKTWERDITIESNNTTYIKGVTLIKDALPVRLFETDATVLSVKGYNDSLLVLKKINELYELHIINATTNSDSLVYRTLNSSEPIVEVSPYASLAYSRIKGTSGDTLYLISLTNPENTDITPITADAMLKWNPTNPTEPLYIYQDKNIHIRSLTRSDRIAGIVSSSIWYRDEEGGIWEAAGHTIKNPHTQTVYTLSDEIDSIVHANNSRIILTHKDKTIVAKLKNDEIESIQMINGIDRYYNRRTEEWLVWSPWELSSIYVDGGISLLNRSGDRIKQVSLLDQNGVLLLATEKELSAFNPGYYVRHTLMSTNSYTIVSTNITRRTLYFFGTFAGRTGVYSLEY